MIVLDTNVISELMRPQPSPVVAAWIAGKHTAELFSTSITEAEILYGIELLTRGKRRETLMAAAEGMFQADFVGRILNFDSDAARAFSEITARRRLLGKPISHPDAQIAAIVRARKAVLATRNVADFQSCGIDVVDPWNAS